MVIRNSKLSVESTEYIAKVTAIVEAHRWDRKLRQKGIDILLGIPIEEIQAYLKTKGLGTFNLSLPFQYTPKNEKAYEDLF